MLDITLSAAALTRAFWCAKSFWNEFIDNSASSGFCSAVRTKNMYTSAFTSKLSVTMFTTTDGKKCDTSRPVDIIAMSCFKPSNFVRTFESRNFSFNRFVSSAICVSLFPSCRVGNVVLKSKTKKCRRRRYFTRGHHQKRSSSTSKSRLRKRSSQSPSRIGIWRRGMNWIPLPHWDPIRQKRREKKTTNKKKRRSGKNERQPNKTSRRPQQKKRLLRRRTCASSTNLALPYPAVIAMSSGSQMSSFL